MNKRIVTLLLAGCLALSVTACKKNDTSTDAGTDKTTGTGTLDSTGTSGSTDDAESTTPETVLDKLSGSAVLGEYKGVTVTKIDTAVSEDDIQEELDYLAEQNAVDVDVEEGRTTVQMWDKVNINYAGKVDGVAFEGGTDDSEEGTDLTIGSGAFIPGFEEALIGFEIGDEKDITVTFPEGYGNDLAGKEAVFTVKINDIVSVVSVPEITDEFIAANTDYSTVEDYKNYLRTTYEAENEERAQSLLKTDAVQAVIDNATFEGVLQEDIDNYYNNMKSYYSAMAGMYGLDEETFVLYFFGMTMEQYESELKTASEFAIKQELVIKAIIEAENLTISDEEYAKGLAEYAEEYEAESAEAFEEANTREVIEEALLMDKALLIIYDNMIVNE